MQVRASLAWIDGRARNRGPGAPAAASVAVSFSISSSRFFPVTFRPNTRSKGHNAHQGGHTMYPFAVVALLGLAVLGVTNLLQELVPGLVRFRRFVTLAVAVGAAVAIDYSLFAGFHVGVREAWMGPLFTGLIVGSLATAWQAVLGWLGWSDPATTDADRSRRARLAP